MMKRVAVTVAVFGFLGIAGLANAASDTARPFPDQTVPLEIARKRVLGRRPLVVGDLKPASDADAETLLQRASIDPNTLAKCVEIGEGVIHASERESSLEFAPPWGWAATTNVATAFCDDGIVILGGSRQETEDGEPRTWLFYWIRTPGQEFGPVSILVRKSHAYTLNELKAIDPVSRQLLFAGTSADGRELLLAARFAILPR